MEKKQINASYYKWARKNKIENKHLILIPINIDNTHWTIMLVIPKSKIMIYLDSFRQDCPQNILDGVLTFVKEYFNVDLKKENWILHNPKDVPRQTNGTDCGIFICAWAFLIATGEPYDFQQSHMDTVRISIANLLCHANINQIKKFKREDGQDTKVEENLQEFIEVESSIPFGLDTTINACAALNVLIPENYLMRDRKRKI